ncbi:hypothetical protein [Methylocystis heyeri]|uniref:Uncharacterized protein n=1 Tax=Methylocystis heyeri TaxID=391905 RepID=A0A6B8KBR2_9HYPH|nr:hypothetical protein [Methylocystis heyeri]QGM45834.1 hypothetical protein H2LOC_009040 [Methylocystis heyeri]
MTPDPKINCDGAAIVVLAGREWFIPVLAMRQSRIVVPGLMRLMPLLAELQSGRSSAMAKLGEEEFDVILDIVHAALTRAYPHLTRDAFLDFAISTPELIGALGIVTRQTGFFKTAEPGEKNVGEARGETPAPLNSSIG